MKRTLRHTILGALVAGATLLSAGVVIADSSPQNVLAGRSSVYKDLDPGSLEDPTTPEAIQAIGAGNVAPVEIYGRLEAGEKVECMECIPTVAKLLYDSNARNREIRGLVAPAPDLRGVRSRRGLPTDARRGH